MNRFWTQLAVASLLVGTSIVAGCPHATTDAQTPVVSRTPTVSGSPASSAAAPSAPPASASSASSADTPSTKSATIASPAGPSAVTVTNLAQPGAFEVTNVGGAPIELASTVAIESMSSGTWGAGPASRVELIEACGAPAPTCVRLAPGARLRPPAWSGYLCSGQCPATTSCRKNPYASGTHRFVVTSCDGTQRFTGPAFTNPSDPPPLKG